MEIKDNEIKKILKKSEDYRKSLNSNIDNFNIHRNEFDCVNELFQTIFDKNEQESCLEDENNIFLECKISKNEAINGCTKKIKYNQISENGKKQKNIINVKIPKEIKNNQKIIIYNKGNYMEQKNKWSSVVITINIK